SDGRLAGGTFATLDNAAPAIAGGMWRGRWNCISLQCADCGRDVCCRDRPRFDGDGDFRSARLRVSYRHAHRPRLPRSGATLRSPIIPAEWKLGDRAIRFAWSRLGSDRAVVYPTAASE